MTTKQETQKYRDGLPAGWWIERTETEDRVVFSVFEDGGATWKNGSPRSAIDVELWKERTRWGNLESARVSWPSTSDKRPVLALALAEALRRAATEASR